MMLCSLTLRRPRSSALTTRVAWGQTPLAFVSWLPGLRHEPGEIGVLNKIA